MATLGGGHWSCDGMSEVMWHQHHVYVGGCDQSYEIIGEMKSKVVTVVTPWRLVVMKSPW